MKGKFLLITLFLFLTILSTIFFLPTNSSTKPKNQVVLIDKTKIPVEIADTPEKITRGLSGRESLNQDSGMYFVLPDRRRTSFWMKEMKFPLDIIWIDQGKIIAIERETPTPTATYIPTFTSPGPVTNVLEVNTGFSEKNGFEVGDEVLLQ